LAVGCGAVRRFEITGVTDRLLKSGDGGVKRSARRLLPELG
jgi:hypothetical protein